jgi:hypothetical protein
MLKVSLDIQRGSIDMLTYTQYIVNAPIDMVIVSWNIIKVSQDTLRCPLDIIGNSRDMETRSKYKSNQIKSNQIY